MTTPYAVGTPTSSTPGLPPRPTMLPPFPGPIRTRLLPESAGGGGAHRWPLAPRPRTRAPAPQARPPPGPCPRGARTSGSRPRRARPHRRTPPEAGPRRRSRWATSRSASGHPRSRACAPGPRGLIPMLLGGGDRRKLTWMIFRDVFSPRGSAPIRSAPGGGSHLLRRHDLGYIARWRGEPCRTGRAPQASGTREPPAMWSAARSACPPIAWSPPPSRSRWQTCNGLRRALQVDVLHHRYHRPLLYHRDCSYPSRRIHQDLCLFLRRRSTAPKYRGRVASRSRR